jgi:hypothetical protein
MNAINFYYRYLDGNLIGRPLLAGLGGGSGAEDAGPSPLPEATTRRFFAFLLELCVRLFV